MTFSLADLLLLIIAVAAVISTIVLIRLANQLGRTSQEVEQLARHVNYMQPRIERLMEEAEAELVQIRGVTSSAKNIATDLELVAENTRKTLLPALQGISAFSEPLRYVSAAMAGAKIGMKVLARRRHKSEDDE